MNVTLIVVVGVLIAVGIGIYLVVEYKVKKWSCVEGKCEKILNGDHSSLEKCQQQCALKKQPFTRPPKEKGKRVTFSPVVSYSETPQNSSSSSSSGEYILV